MSTFKTKNQEIQYLHKMLYATVIEDKKRLSAIGVRLIQLACEIK